MQNSPVYRYTYFSQMDVVHRHFSRSYRNHDKDVILFENGKLNVYIATLEIVRLSDGKN